MPIDPNPLLAQGLYYSYDRLKPMIWRILSLGSRWPVYCERCAKPVAIGRLIVVIAISEASLKDPEGSAIVRQLRNKDWSALDRADPPLDCYRDASLRIELGRCDACRGPFCAFGRVQGIASDEQRTLLFGAVFLGELAPGEAVALLEAALENDLMGSDGDVNEAIAVCKNLGSNLNFDRLTSDRETRHAALRLGELGALEVENGRLEAARDAFKSALRTFAEIGDRRFQVTTIINLANVHIDLGDLDEAEKLLHSSLELSDERGGKRNGMFSLGLLGTIYEQRREFDRAESMYLRARQVAMDMGDTDDVALAHHALGKLFEKSNRSQQARQHYAEALRLYEQTGNREDAQEARESLHRLSR
jgi:tetratricopeptide (TPR) repeat protein